MFKGLAAFYKKENWLFNSYFLCLITTLVFGYCCPTMASEENYHPGELLQTNITQNDLKIIEQLVAIAERNSSQVLEAKTAMGWRRFQDVISVELSPSLTTTNYNSPDDPEERENSFYVSISIDPIRLISAFERKQLLKSRLQEARQQKRLAVIQHYLVYIQARQATKIAAYRMQNFIASDRIASLNPSGISVEKIKVEKIKNINNPEYVAAVTQMLNFNAQEQIALEELAACVGLSSQEIIFIFNDK